MSYMLLLITVILFWIAFGYAVIQSRPKKQDGE